MQLLAVWDEVLPKLEQMTLDDDEQARISEHDAWDEVSAAAHGRVEGDRSLLRRAAERVEMLGPEEVEQAALVMVETHRNLGDCILGQYKVIESVGREPIAAFWQLEEQVNERRAVFVAAAKETLRQTPDTKGS
ncbi:hypothetical protein [Streptomyces sp. NPDC056463]|uniref:hypothetical protein n=1 Tax=Streptomyces sp. NPDC056463 TaxID=3345827 RepID=UPI0036AD96B6